HKASSIALAMGSVHGSAYDPARGSIVLTPPTVKPLPAIKLEWDQNTDELYAVDVVGPTILE
ncbi:hypothetical protein, partial [Citrobacter youngae]|uniref:hypothetical protein n=1 Tax=Citrobacter youngae TaxID=133448 RepID=UPI0019543DD0